MQARDVMSKAVVSVAPETPVGRIAALLMEHGISAVPVVDHGKVIGMVSEGDLLGRSGSAAEDRRDWWLAWVAEGHALPPGYLTSAATRERTAREVMVHPAVTIDADRDVAEIATLLIERRIKRVPVLEDGKLVGIVSRADLLAALAGEHAGTAVSRVTSTLFSAPPPLPAASGTAPAAAPADDTGHGPTAADFRHLVGDFRHDAVRRRQEEEQEAHVRRQNLVKQLIGHHIADHAWNAILSTAHAAAARGERESLMLRFPSEMCSDGGRAINAPEPDWPTSLRGEAAEIYQRWLRDLQPAGFHLSARILDFPGGFPGDVGLFLVWGDEK